MTIHATVSNTTQLTNTLNQLRNVGGAIYLEPGFYDGQIRFSNYAFAAPVRITSADTSKPAQIAGLYFSNSSNIHFDNLEFVTRHPNGTQVDDYYTNRFYNCTDISFTNSWFHGTLDHNPNDDSTTGLMFQGGGNLYVADCEFEQLDRGLTQGNTSNVVFTRNVFHDISSDGIDSASVQNVTITHNVFTNFYPQASDHPDAIQFWDAATPSSDIVIDSNVMVTDRGYSPEGGAPLMQGIFFRNDPIGNAAAFSNVAITNNLLVNTAYNGIYISNANTCTISNNVIATLANPNGFRSWFRLVGVTDLTFENNWANVVIMDVPSFYSDGSPVNWSSNTTTTAADLAKHGSGFNPIYSDNGRGVIQAWLNERNPLYQALPQNIQEIVNGVPTPATYIPVTNTTVTNTTVTNTTVTNTTVTNTKT